MTGPGDPCVLVGEFEDAVWLRVEGRGTFQSSPGLKSVVERLRAGGRKVFVVDLAGCPLMDSTFMGTLTGLAVRMIDGAGGRLVVVNANGRNLELLENLGLDQVIEVDKEGAVFPELRGEVNAALMEREGTGAMAKEDQAAHVLEAHETLADLNAGNRDRFRDVVAFLRAEVRRDGMPE